MNEAVQMLGRRTVQGVIRLYQWTAGAWLGGRCRFYPSCSEYGWEAVERHGTLRGGWLTLKRVCKCHPLNPGGVDLVPPSTKSNEVERWQ